MKIERLGVQKILPYGLPGVGKTTSLRTLAATGKQIIIVGLENNCSSALSSFGETLSKEELQRFHYVNIAPRTRGLESLLSSANDVLKKSPDVLATLSDKKRSTYDAYTRMLQAFSNLTDSDGVELGSIDDWDSEYILVIDSLTAVCWNIKTSVVGGSTAINQAAWGRMQSLLQQFLKYIVEDLRCHVVLLGHATVQTNSITGFESIYPATIGQALKDVVPSFFSEVLYATRHQGKYQWHPVHNSAVTATRTKKLNGLKNIKQDFMVFDW